MNEKVTCADCKHFNARNNVCAVLENTVRPGYGCYEGEPRIITNGDKIRQMSDEELARYICRDLGIPCAHCPVDNECGLSKGSYGALMDWLKQEAPHE